MFIEVEKGIDCFHGTWPEVRPNRMAIDIRVLDHQVTADIDERRVAFHFLEDMVSMVIRIQDDQGPFAVDQLGSLPNDFRIGRAA